VLQNTPGIGYVSPNPYCVSKLASRPALERFWGFLPPKSLSVIVYVQRETGIRAINQLNLEFRAHSVRAEFSEKRLLHNGPGIHTRNTHGRRSP